MKQNRDQDRKNAGKKETANRIDKSQSGKRSSW